MPEGAEHIEPGPEPSENTNPAAHTGVLMPAFEAIMAQKYRFQVRAEPHSGVMHSVAWRKSHRPRLPAQDVDEKCRQAFRQFDHGKGYITVEVRAEALPVLWSERASHPSIDSVLLTALQDALSAFRAAAPYIPEQTVRDVFYEADNDGHGKVSYRDFSSILCAAQ